MRPDGRDLLVFLISLLQLASAQSPSSDNERIVCYYADWAPYRMNQGKFTPQNIHPYLCTHLIYSFGKTVVENATIVPGDEWQDIGNNGFKDFVSLKVKYNPNLKCLFAIGGYREGSSLFSPISGSPEKRKQFAQNTLKFLRNYGFDGLNLDWQYPNDQQRGGLAEDVDNFVLLLKAMDEVYREEGEMSGKPKLLLTITVPGNTLIIENGYNMTELQKYIDFANVICYDYHFAFDPFVNHHSPLYPLPEEVAGSKHDNEGLNADSTINYLLGIGVLPEKLNLGIPMYGRTFTLEDKDQNSLGSPATGQGAKGKATREDGYVSYYEVCRNVKDGWNVVHHNKTAMGPYAFKDSQWVSYDDDESVRRKGEYAKTKGLGGLSFWSIDQDDFIGACGLSAFPLINAGREGYMRAKGPAKFKKNIKIVQRPVPSPASIKAPSSGDETSEIRRPLVPAARGPSALPEMKAPLPTLLSPFEPIVLYVPVVCYLFPYPSLWFYNNQDNDDDTVVVDASRQIPPPQPQPQQPPPQAAPRPPPVQVAPPPPQPPQPQAPPPPPPPQPQAPPPLLPPQVQTPPLPPIPSIPLPVRTTADNTAPPGGIVQNIYIWVTNNIFHYHTPESAPKEPSTTTSAPTDEVDIYRRAQTKRTAELRNGFPVWS